MTDRLKKAFDNIRAEGALKTSAKDFLHKEILRRSTKQNHILPRRVFVAFSSLTIILFSGGMLSYLYFTPDAYIDMDVNPSFEITLNHFDRVIDTYAYNPDGRQILEDADVKYKNYEEAVSLLLDTIAQKGYTQENGLISITLQSNSGKKETAMLSYIESVAESHHGTAQIECFAIGGHLRDTAHHLNLSPAKYLAIQHLIEVDPAASWDCCREHTIGELKAMTQEHGGSHHHATDADESANPGTGEKAGQGNRHHRGRHHP